MNSNKAVMHCQRQSLSPHVRRTFWDRSQQQRDSVSEQKESELKAIGPRSVCMAHACRVWRQ
jgi:hypothetical protein